MSEQKLDILLEGINELLLHLNRPLLFSLRSLVDRLQLHKQCLFQLNW